MRDREEMGITCTKERQLQHATLVMPCHACPLDYDHIALLLLSEEEAELRMNSFDNNAP